MSDPRWLDTYAAAGHIGLSPDAFRRRVKAGTLPKPSEALGPRNPRWDRAALVEALKHADLQLEYIDQRSPSGTTPAVRAQIGAALALYREAGR